MKRKYMMWVRKNMTTNRKLFQHKGSGLNYDDLECITESTGRRYVTPEGKKYPSITTVLSILSEDSIREWRARVGEEEANKISHRAASRGTAVHSIIEDYINNKEDYSKKYMPNVVQDFKRVKDILDSRIGEVYAQEVPLYSDYFKIAGRVDCIAEFDGILSVIDFKTSRKTKKKEWIENYFIQESFYAAAFYERTGIPIKQIVTIISVDNDESQVFIEEPLKWLPKLTNVRKEYSRREFFGTAK